MLLYHLLQLIIKLLKMPYSYTVPIFDDITYGITT